MMGRVLGMAAGVAALTGAANAARAETPQFELLSATLDGRLTLAIVNHDGAAVAVELHGDETEIIRGVAAGAILSDLRDLAAAQAASSRYEVSSGSAHSQVRVNGALRVEQATPMDAARVIDGLPNLTPQQRQQLRALLSL